MRLATTFARSGWPGAALSPLAGAEVSVDATRPALAFALEDLQESAPRRGQLALERLVFKCGGEGHPCVAASERETGAHSADMMSYFTSCGCPAETALHATLDLEQGRAVARTCSAGP